MVDVSVEGLLQSENELGHIVRAPRRPHAAAFHTAIDDCRRSLGRLTWSAWLQPAGVAHPTDLTALSEPFSANFQLADHQKI
jgi:hypothetical protein